MIVLDTSALVAIFFMEPDAEVFLRAVQQAVGACMSAASFLEIAIVIDNRDAPEQWRDLDRFLAEAGVEILPVTAGQARIARDAYRRYGKGKHPAGLNFSDCFAYALAKERDLPLLFKGEDFARTDIPAVL